MKLLAGLIHRIDARAERRVEKELIGGLMEVPGKKGIYLRMINAVLDKLDETGCREGSCHQAQVRRFSQIKNL